MTFIVDTDVCSAHLRGNQEVATRLLHYGERAGISVITAAELLSWSLRAKTSASRRSLINDFLDRITVYNVDRQVADWFGRLRAEQLDRGAITPDLDLLIASTAIAHDATLVTHNTRDFVNIPQLQLVDWLMP